MYRTQISFLILTQSGPNILHGKNNLPNEGRQKIGKR